MNALTDCPQNHIFVFGSNLNGVHGRGAAKTARLEYGARLGVGVGPTGMAYAIPTKDGRFQSLPLAEINLYVERFLEFARSRQDVAFYVTPIGTGLAGYSHDAIAPMFKGAPNNCYFSEQWETYL